MLLPYESIVLRALFDHSFENCSAFAAHGVFRQKRIDSMFGKVLYCCDLENFGSVAQLVEQRPFKPEFPSVSTCNQEINDRQKKTYETDREPTKS
jgi:hypothetical protein